MTKKMRFAVAVAALAVTAIIVAFLLPSTKKSSAPAPAPTFPKVIDTDAVPTVVKTTEPKGGPWAMTVTPDGKLILQTGQNVRGYDKAGEVAWQIKCGHSNTLDVTSDGTWLAICTHQRVHAYNLKTQEWGPATPEVGWKYGGVSSATWISNTELLYTEGAGGVTLWSILQNGPSGSVHSYDLMAENAMSYDGAVMLNYGRRYRAQDAQYRIFISHFGPRTKDGRGLAKQKEVVVPKIEWATETPHVIFALRPDGRRATLHEKKTKQCREYDVTSDGLNEAAQWSTKDAQSCLAYSPDGKTLAGITKAGILSLWDMTQHGSEASVIDLKLNDFSPLGNRVKWSRDGSAIGYMAWGQAGVVYTKNKE
jgi:WD40 repeat protein